MPRGADQKIQQDARVGGDLGRPALADDRPQFTKGWTGPKMVDGLQVEAPSGRTRCRSRPGHPSRTPQAVGRLARSYRPEELFDEQGRLKTGTGRTLPPKGERRMGAKPHANAAFCSATCGCRIFRDYAVDVPGRGTRHRRTHVLGVACAMWRS